jgi:hypothetical protein
VKPYQSQNKAGQKQQWDLLEEFQGVFEWHKGELGYCYVGEHSIDTQKLPPCWMTIGKWPYWEEAKVNK